MPDPSMSDALKEAYAIAPADSLIIHTLEFRHPAFVNDNGQPDSAFVTTNQEDVLARLEADAPVRALQIVRFRHIRFRVTLAPIEVSPRPKLSIEIDNITRLVARQLQRAKGDPRPVELCYREYLASDLSAPQRDELPTFVLSEVEADLLTVRATAYIDIDLNRAFPSVLYTAVEYPGLIGA